MTFSAQEIATAYHEAGHAVLALALGRTVSRVSVLPNHLRQGQCDIQKGAFRASQDVMETQVLILLGGLVAEARHTGHYCPEGASQDLRVIRSLTNKRATTQKQIERLERRMVDKAEHILDRPGVWSAVEKIAAELLRCSTISGRAARHLFDAAVNHESP
jgi:ATP-dependent Zn protease